MKAIVCTRYGKTEDVVELRDMPLPQVLSGDVLIEVHAASVNPVDFKIQQGAMRPIRKFPLPFIMGYDVSGVVVAVGPSVKRFKVGDEVFSRVDSYRFGTFAEFIAVDETYLALKPGNISHQEAAAVPLAALTAWQALRSVAQVKPGHKVLIHAGAGGVGTMAIQLAKQLGASVATTTSTKNVALVKSLGADVVVDYTQQAFESTLSDFDVVLETLGGDNVARSFRVLKPGGLMVSIAGIPSAAWARSQGLPFFMPWLFGLLNWKNHRLARQHQARYESVMLQSQGSALSVIADMIAAGKIRIVVDRVFALEQTRQALIYSQSGRVAGKIVISVK